MAPRPDRRAAEMLRGLKGRIDKLEQANVSDRSGQSSEEFVVSPIVKVEDQLDGDESITISKSLEPGSDLIDDFEDGDMSEYAENTASAHIVEYPVHQGDFAVRMDSDSSGVEQPVTSTSGLPYYPSDGDTFRYRIYAPGTESFCRFYFAASDSDNGYRVDYDTSAGELVVARFEGGTRTDLFTVALSSTPVNEWVEVEIAWSSGGGFSAELFDAAGSSLGSGSTTDSTYLSGGIGWGAGSAALNEQRSAYFDFARTTTSANVIDDFEDENVSEYSGDTASATVKSSAAIPVDHGVYALELSGVATIRAVEGNLNNDATAGDTFESHHHLATGSAARFLFGLQDSSNHYFVEADEPNGDWILGKVDGGTESTLASDTTVTIPTSEWVTYQVDWASNGAMTAKIFDASGTELASISATDTTWSSGGHGWTEAGSVTSYHDYALVVPDGAQELGTQGIDDFEDGDIAEYSGDTGSYSVVTNAYEGTYAIEVGTGFPEIISTSGLPNYPESSDLFSWRGYLTATGGATQMMFGVQDSNNFYLAVITESDVTLYEEDAGTLSQLSTTGITAATGEWLQGEVSWGSPIIVRAFDAAGNKLGETFATDASYTSGGIGWRGEDSRFDLAEVTGAAEASAVGTIDDFEDGDLSEYSGDTGSASVQSTTVFEGSNASELSGASGAAVKIYSNSGLDEYPLPGDTVNMRGYIDSPDGRVMLWLATDSDGNSGYEIVANHGGSQISIFRVDDGSFTSLASSTVTVPDAEWLKFDIQWGGDGTITYTLYDAAGSQVGQISATDTTYGSGGIALRGFDASNAWTVYHDIVEIV